RAVEFRRSPFSFLARPIMTDGRWTSRALVTPVVFLRETRGPQARGERVQGLAPGRGRGAEGPRGARGEAPALVRCVGDAIALALAVPVPLPLPLPLRSNSGHRLRRPETRPILEKWPNRRKGRAIFCPGRAAGVMRCAPGSTRR